ncbi:DUF4242 domain-containing protein [Lysobacter niastensis]|uniref:DUF4242 domain-containing protein n=1 Tax=Lysobacter niastensis TaxID=380629 RepID=A0ABS0B872_9GAMM|nr:DUF4242 domain-containing protein [Lysobacter niastensis]MBF6025216.1 DUF4242 domain-containing protein [Lysobacter niastensis]
MPRYLVERTFADALSIPVDAEGARFCAKIAGVNGDCGVTWLHSYVSADRRKTFCIYDAPAPEAIRQVARRNGLPVTSITEISVLEPYFYF